MASRATDELLSSDVASLPDQPGSEATVDGSLPVCEGLRLGVLLCS